MSVLTCNQLIQAMVTDVFAGGKQRFILATKMDTLLTLTGTDIYTLTLVGDYDTFPSENIPTIHFLCKRKSFTQLVLIFKQAKSLRCNNLYTELWKESSFFISRTSIAGSEPKHSI